MEQVQTQPASNALSINTQILSNLPDTLVANSSLADRAVAKVRADLGALTPGDITTVKVELMESNDAQLAGLQSKLKEAYNLMNERRSPFTRLFTEITSKFTAEEKKVVEIGNEVKALRDSWQREKARRNSIEQEKQAKELEKKQALIDARTYIARCIIEKFSTHAVDAIKRMHAKFYELTADELAGYTVALRKWTPALDQATWATFLEGVGNPKPQLITPEQLAGIRAEVETEQRPKLEKEWIESMTRERDGLVELVASRKKELERIAQQGEQAKKEADERIAREAQEREAQAKRDAEDKAQALEQAASVDSLNASFDVAAQSAPVVGMAKGTVVKKKYQPKSHKAHVAIIQWWVKERMSSMTLDELQTKLSFMRTAADKALNEGTVIEADGLEVVEDYSTRASSKKTA
jgi:hypothetical protein